MMKTIETRVQVTTDGQLVLDTPLPITPGEYQVVLVLEEQVVSEAQPPFDFPVDDLGPWLQNLSLRREELYGDDEH